MATMPASNVVNYEYRTSFRAPLEFVFRWCTDYQSSDAKLEQEPFVRRIVSRSARRVVYEDVEELPQGWSWRRHTVTLSPPSRWHSDSVGNYRNFVLDYELRSLPDGRTEMRFRGRRRPGLLPVKAPSAKAFYRSMERSWRLFRRQLESDYRRANATRGRSRRASRSV